MNSPRKSFRKPSGKLTTRQTRFANEFIKDLNIAAAARRAGISSRYGIELFSKPHVLARIEQLQAERLKRTEVNADWILRRLLAELEANVQDLYDDSGVLKHPRDWPEVWQKGLVTSIRTTELYERDGTGRNVVVGQLRDVTLVDRVRRLELMGKHVSIAAFRERMQVGVDNPLQRLYQEISGQAIRPAGEIQTIEHQSEEQNEASHEAQLGTAHGMRRNA